VRSAGVISLSLALTLTSAACSPLASVPPPNRPLVSPEQCSDSRWPVVGDTYLAINTGSISLLLFGVAAAEYAENTHKVVPSWDARPLAVSPGLLIGGVLSAAATAALIRSAKYGLDSARACERARAELYTRNPGLYNLAPVDPEVLPQAPQPWPSR
jgi:hypothetical protein